MSAPVHGDGLGAECTRPDEEVGAAAGVDDPQAHRPAGQGADHVRIRQGTTVARKASYVTSFRSGPAIAMPALAGGRKVAGRLFPPRGMD